MRAKKRARPCLELLEDRWVPASIQFAGGNLFISNPVGPLTVTQDATVANKFTVQNGASTTSYSGVSSINITGTNGADSITVDFGGRNYTGSLAVNAGNGNDTIAIRASGGGSRGTIQVLPGLGNDSVSLNNTGGTGTFNGSLQVTDQKGNDSISLGNATGVSTFGGVALSGMNTVRLAFGKADVYGGAFSASTASESVPLDFETAGTTTPATLNSGLQLTGGAGDDIVILSSLVVNRDVNVNLGGSVTAPGNSLDEFFPPTLPLVVNGNLTYTGGSGSDFVQLPGSTISGNLSLNLGDGDDEVDLSTFGGLFASPTIGGNLSITAGNGNDFFDGFTGEGITALVSGDIRVNVGNGNDSLALVNAPGGRFFWTSGNGAATVTLGSAATAGAQAWNVSMRFGTGNDTLSLSPDAPATQSLTGFIDMGGPAGGNSFDPDGSLGINWQIVQPFTLQNV